MPSCEAISKTVAVFRGLQSVVDAVVSAVPGAKVQVKVMDGRFLNVALVNSAVSELPADQRQAKAREIAGIAFRAYPSRSSLETVAVTLGVNINAAVVSYSSTTDTFKFSVNELDAVVPTPAVTPREVS